ncbi:hypothetical protein ACVR1G_08215 [Streptococcus dentasini]
MFLFPSVVESDFDFSADWLVVAMDDTSKIITFDGTGQNQDLSMTLSYENPLDYRSFSIGDLINFPRETFVDIDGPLVQ